MKIKYKASISILLIFTINLVLLLFYYEIFLKPTMSETIKESLQSGVYDKINSSISSKTEADALIIKLERSINDNSFRNSIANSVIKNLLLFEVCILFLLLLLSSIILYLRYVKPLEVLIEGMDNFSRGIVPKKHKNRKDELGQLQDKFVELTLSLEAEKQKQNRIIASISHDVKTPLTVVMGYSERLLKNNFPAEREKRYLNTIYTKSQSINEILNEFDEYLSYNFESTLSIKEYDVAYICDYIKSEYSEELADMKVAFSVINNCENCKISMDLLKFKRVIGNLISNSLKHTSTSPSLSLTLSHHNNGILFSFKDNGSGVSKEDLAFIFDPLYTSDTSRKVAGFGLSICKNIITAHKGEIKAKNINTGGLQVDIFLAYKIYL